MRVLISGGPAFLKIAEAIKADEYVTIFPQVGKSLFDADLPAKDLSEFFHREDWPEVWTWLHAAGKSLNGTALSAEAAGFVLSRIVHFLPYVIALDRAKPDVVVLHNDIEPATRLVALWARTRGIPCLHVPHAIYVDHPWRGPLGTDIHDVVTADHIAAAGPFQAEWYRARSNDAEIRVTGAPRWDWIASWNVSKEKARRLLHIPDSSPVLTYATSWAQKTSKRGSEIDPFFWFQEFLKAVEELPIILIVKLHPSAQDGQRYVEAVLKSNVRAVITAAHLPYVLTASDLVVVFGPSNVVLEAAALGVPVLCHLAPFPIKGVRWIEKPDGEMIMSLLLGTEPLPKDRVTAFTGPLDGHATERVAAWVRELCRRGQD